MSIGPRVLVALGLNDLDPSLLRYAGMVCRTVKASRVYFHHVVTPLDVSVNVRDRFPLLCEATLEDAVEVKMRERVSEHFGATDGMDIHYESEEGAALRALLVATKKHGVDLLVAGRNPRHRWGATLTERLARHAPCSVLIVPAGCKETMKRLLVPVDFSEHSANALNEAVTLGNAQGSAEVSCLHVYTVPAGYHKTGKSYEEFAQIMRQNAANDWEIFRAGLDTKSSGVNCDFILDASIANGIHQAIEIGKPDLLVLGARGRTNCSAMMLGSVTERCLLSGSIPMLAVKHKGENMRLLEALLYL